MSERPRLLAVAAAPPWPIRHGYSLRVHHLVRELATRWNLRLVAPPVDSGHGAWPCDGVRHVEVGLRARWAGVAFTASDHPALRSAVRRQVAEFGPQAVLLWSGTEWMAFDPQFPAAVGDRIDSGTLIAWRDIRAAGTMRARLRIARRVLRFARYERDMVRVLGATIAVAEDDARVLARLGGRPVEVVANGVAVPEHKPEAAEAETPTVVFSGVMNYGPNVEAVRHFVRDVWPRVLAELPAATFIIAGRAPTRSVGALADEAGVRVTGEVEDMGVVLREAWLAVAPMVSGAGMKNKVLEAWAEGRPVVLSRLAARGLALDDETRSLVAADAGRMADLIVRLLRDRTERMRRGEAGRRLVVREHGWGAAADRVSELLERVCL
ncbi:MAG: glycosyltransferase [Gemmatimonadota bacterium]